MIRKEKTNSTLEDIDIGFAILPDYLNLGYGFEIAIRDIKRGEQITDEYGIFNLDSEMTLLCGEPGCRKTIGPNDFDTYYKDWDKKIVKSIAKLFEVDQPLMAFVEPVTRSELDAFFENPEFENMFLSQYENCGIS